MLKSRLCQNPSHLYPETKIKTILYKDKSFATNKYYYLEFKNLTDRA